jgi:hypothetical protein
LSRCSPRWLMAASTCLVSSESCASHWPSHGPRAARARPCEPSAHPQRGRSDVRGVYCRSRGPSQTSPARRSQSLRPVPRSTARIRAVGIDFPSQWGAFSQVEGSYERHRRF